nr:DNA-directed RNA polymerase II subunit RPB1-like [Halyomorpha halys]
MEWLFGSIKKSPKPEVYVSNVVEGDFNVVSSSQEPARPPYPLYPTVASSHGYTQAPYPPTYPAYSPQQPHYSQQYQKRPPYVQQSSSAAPVNKPVNPLDSIPFKISSMDTKSLPVSEYQLKSIKNQLDSASNRINSDSYNYSFELERSVLSEVNY